MRPGLNGVIRINLSNQILMIKINKNNLLEIINILCSD